MKSDRYSITQAIDRIYEHQASGTVSEVGGAYDPSKHWTTPEGRPPFDCLWLTREDGEIVNARHFGIVHLAFDLDEGRPLAIQYEEWGQIVR